jgi:hypothetical protein
MSICLDMPCLCVYAFARHSHTRAHASTSSKSSTLCRGGLRTRTRASQRLAFRHIAPVRIQIMPCVHVTSGLRERATACPHTEISHIQRSHLRTPPLLCIRRCQLPGVALATRQTGRILNRPRNHSHASKNSPAQCAAQRCSMMRSRSLVDNNKRRVQHDCDCCSGGRRRRRVGCAFLWGASGVLHHSGGHQPQHPHAAVRYRTQRPTTRLHPLFVHTQLGSWGSFAVSSTCTFCCSDFCGQIQPRACNRTCPPPPSSFVARAIPSRGNYSTVTDSRNHVAACNAHSICRVQKSNAACA